jgi:hypothetical protein
MNDELRLKEILSNKWNRLESLYKIEDKKGKLVRFIPNEVQRDFNSNLWYLNIILKSRQHGMSTDIELVIGDTCIFNSNVSAGIIADTLPNAKKLLKKIRTAYINLSEEIKSRNPLVTDSKTELEWANGSSVYVGTTMRSGTVQYLHISEFGKICAKTPEKAREIVTGALEAVTVGQYVFIESTAEGEAGYFYEYCMKAEDMKLTETKLSKMDYKFFFYAWFQDKGNALHEDISIPNKLKEYFEMLKIKHKIDLTQPQKNWYTKKYEKLQDDMLREHPSTPDEAFRVSTEGAYYKRQFNKILEQKRITKVDYDPALDVYTSWDLGVNDTTAIWFIQVYGSEFRVIDCYENSGEGLGHYLEYLRSKEYKYAKHYFPHDIKVREFSSGKSREQVLIDSGLDNYEIVPKLEVADGIEAVRKILGQCYFDEEKCSEGVKALRAYRKEWDERLETFKKSPLHDWSSNYADSFRYFAVGYTPKTTVERKPLQKRKSRVNFVTGKIII